jgi:hypothetical protein
VSLNFCGPIRGSQGGDAFGRAGQLDAGLLDGLPVHLDRGRNVQVVAMGVATGTFWGFLSVRGSALSA